jgi:Vasohibin
MYMIICNLLRNLMLYKCLAFLFVRGVTHRHIVLAVRLEEKWGAIGISRRDCLMKKKTNFDSLTDLIREFESSYVSETCFVLFTLDDIHA